MAKKLSTLADLDAMIGKLVDQPPRDSAGPLRAALKERLQSLGRWLYQERSLKYSKSYTLNEILARIQKGLSVEATSKPSRPWAPASEEELVRRAAKYEHDGMIALAESDLPRSLVLLVMSEQVLGELCLRFSANEEHARAAARLNERLEEIERLLRESREASAVPQAGLQSLELTTAFESKRPVGSVNPRLLGSQAPVGLEGQITKGRSLDDGLATAKLTEPLLRTRDERIKHFSGRLPWTAAVKADPSLKPLAHIDRTYPDRRRGLLRPDLWKIDRPLANALRNWMSYRRSDGSAPNVIPSDFGLMTAEEWYARLDEEDGPVTGAQVMAALRRGDPNADEMSRRFAAAERRAKKMPKRPRAKSTKKRRAMVNEK